MTSWGAMAGQLGWGFIEEGWRKGPWTAEEDRLLMEYVRLHGEGRWNSVARLTGLKRNGKSCRLRWVNYLRPDLKRGQITPNEDIIILELHARWGNRWSTIARSLPGRTDNEIKNYWRTHFKKKSKLSPDTSEKAKNRLLRRQQFQQQQELQLQQQQQQQQEHLQQLQLQQLNQLDLGRIMSLLDDNNDQKAATFGVVQLPMQEVVTTTTAPATASSFNPQTASCEEQGFFHPIFSSTINGIGNNSGSGGVHDQVSNNYEDILWDGLWNLDDMHGNFGVGCAPPSKASSVHNLVAPFC